MKLKKISDTEENVLSRYMNFDKLLFLLDKGLYFTSLQKFDDPLDGATSLQKFFTRIFQIRESGQINQGVDLSNLAQKETIKSEIDSYQKNVFASCWFRSNSELEESIAMWNLYTKKDDGFLLQIKKNSLLDLLSSVNNIKDCHEDIHFGSVNYFTFFEEIVNPNPADILHPAFVKNKSYEHEKEFRIVIYRNPKLEEIEYMSIDLDIKNTLNDVTIIAHPNMEKGILDEFKVYFNKFNLDLKESSLITKDKMKSIFN